MKNFVSFRFFRNRLTGAALALGAFALPVHDAEAQEIRADVICDLDFLVIATMKDSSYFPSGIRASSDKWEMEIYINPNTDQWILTGVSKHPEIAPSDEICQLSFGKAPYVNNKWYAEHFTGTDADNAHRVATALIKTANSTKESGQQFYHRVSATFRRVMATDLMALEAFGEAWRTMPSSQRTEATQLYEKFILLSLHGAYDAALPDQFTLVGGRLYESEGGLMKARCNILRQPHCVAYIAKAKANDRVIEYRLLKRGNGWQVVDIKMEGVLLQFVYRRQIQENLRRVGVARALDALRASVLQD